MKLTTERCRAANDSMFLLPTRSVSPNAYCAPSLENKLRASADVIQPRSSGGNADKERASAASVVPSSLAASRGAATPPNISRIKLFMPISALLLPAPWSCARTFSMTIDDDENAIVQQSHVRYTPESSAKANIAGCPSWAKVAIGSLRPARARRLRLTEFGASANGAVTSNHATGWPAPPAVAPKSHPRLKVASRPASTIS